MGADYAFYAKSIATYAPTFFGYNNSVLAIVYTTLDIFWRSRKKVRKKCMPRFLEKTSVITSICLDDCQS
jgi:hypothetical protein